MDSSAEQFQSNQLCGSLIFNDESKAFVYHCNKCECKFATGCGLEVHFVYEHTNKADGAMKNSDVGLVGENDAVSIKIDANDLLSDEGAEEEIAILSENSGKSVGISKIKSQKRKRTAPAPNVFYCDMCPGERFSNFSKIRQHMKCHSAKKSPKQCQICGEYSICLALHLEQMHGIKNLRNYECGYCDVTFTTNDARLVHERSHTNEPQRHQCPECHRSFRTPGELRQHQNSMHFNHRPYVCVLCDKPFPSRQYLRIHQLSHGEKVYECTYCAKKFKSSAAKRWHERKIHESSQCQRLEIELA